MKRIVIVVLIALAALSGWSRNDGPDFNYPKQVAKEADNDLKKALEKGDGQMIVDAIVRASIAQSQLSCDKMANIIDRIDQTVAREPNAATKALLLYFEAFVMYTYSNAFIPVDRRGYDDIRYHDPDPKATARDSYAKWTRDQFQSRIDELAMQSLADSLALCAVQVTSLPRIIKCDKLGASYVPTLYQFLINENMAIVSNPIKERLKQLRENSTKDNITAYTWARMKNIDDKYSSHYSREDYLKIIAEQPNEEINGLLLQYLNNDEDYDLLRNYVAKFPKSVYTNDVKNNISYIERTSVKVNQNGQWNSREPMKLYVSSRNVNHFDVDVYRLTEEMLSPNYKEDRYKIKDMERAATLAVDAPGTVPYDTSFTVTIPPLPYGIYVIVPRYINAKGKTTMLEQVSKRDLMVVYDLASFAVADNGNDNRIIVVDVATGAPVSGAIVSGDNWSATTNRDGIANLPEQTGYASIYYKVSKGDDKYGPQTNFRRVENNRSTANQCQLFTDLAIYRPGETIHFAGIVYFIAVNTRHVLSGASVDIIFNDANNKTIDKLTLTTDKYGRVEGSFEVPTDRLLGTYTLRMYPRIEGPRTSAYKSVQVSEYKTPTFHVDLAYSDMAYKPGEPITVTGTARTYTDLPVANAEVKLSLRQREWDWLWWRSPWMRPMTMRNTEVADTVVRTDADGRFTITFAPDRFYENQHHSYCHYIYDTHVQVTNVGGESQQADATFHIGSKRALIMSESSFDINNTKPARIPVSVNCTDSTLMPKYLEWAICRNYSDTVMTGTMPTDNPVIDFTSLPSGSYKLCIAIPGSEWYYENKTEYIDLYKVTDSKAPVKDTPLWVPSDGYYIDDNNVAHVTIGSSIDKAYVYYVASGRKQVLGQGWLELKSGFTEFTFKVPDMAYESLIVQFTSMYRTRFYNKEVKMTSPVNARPLKVKATAFRDRLMPGKPERWQLQLLGNGDKPTKGAMMLEMIDRAIHDLQNNNWVFSPGLLGCTPMQLWLMKFYSNSQNTSSWSADRLNSQCDYSEPEFIKYDTKLWEGCAKLYSRYLNLGGAVYENKSARVLEKSIAEVEEEQQEQPAVDMKRLDNVELRLADIKTALWQPLLESDEQGNITLEFNAPNFNTTWLLQTIAFTDEVSATTWMQNVLTQKPIMVKPSLPRFVRQGDKVTLAATLQNATDIIQQCDAIVELFDPRTNTVYASQTFKRAIDANATQALTIDWIVPDTIPYLGFRVRAANADFSDGEQTMIPVLTTITPIVESLPLFIDVDQNTFTATLPNAPETARYTLEYCDNPVWYTVTALPSIASDNSFVATSIAHTLYAVDVAQGVANSQPIIREAVNYWKENCQDSMLVSALSRNSDLKIGNLVASPWLNDSERQTLQMQQLATYFEPSEAKSEHDRLVKALGDLQLSDGGFTWYRYDGCKSSRWTTGEVLELIGEIHDLGYLPQDKTLNDMISKAVAYYDKAHVDLSKKKEYKKAIFSDYAYVRSLFPEVPHTKASNKLFKKTLKNMGKQWNKLKLSQGEKAFYAITLEREGMHKQALPIVQSIREFALTDSLHGMYWDNYLGRGWYTPSQVAVTSTVLQALHAVDRQQSELDQVRKWMLLGKQTTDWGGSSLAADATYSLLSTGNQWLDRAQAPSIILDGKPIEMDRFDAYMGYSRKSIDAHAGSQLYIERNGNSPAWGAIYWQYSQPMSEVQSANIEDLSIQKDFYPLTPSGIPQQGDMKVGDKVQVRLTITCGRDMDYMTLTDERASCFEPVDRTSGYRYSDGVGYYRETHDAGTNLFFYSLSKGTHVITYEVFVTNPGQFTSGVATIQSQQAPEITAHSAGNTLTILPAEK